MSASTTCFLFKFVATNVNINNCDVLRIGRNCIFDDYSFSSDVLCQVDQVAD